MKLVSRFDIKILQTEFIRKTKSSLDFVKDPIHNGTLRMVDITVNMSVYIAGRKYQCDGSMQ